MNDKQKINKLVNIQGEDSQTIAELLIKNTQLCEAINSALQLLKGDHIQANSFRLGVLGSQDIENTIHLLDDVVAERSV